MSNRIKHTCAKCGWTGSVVAEWTDISPRKCLGRKCKTSFRKNPEHLLTELPTNEHTRTVGEGRKTKEPSKGSSSGRSESGNEKS